MSKTDLRLPGRSRFPAAVLISLALLPAVGAWSGESSGTRVKPGVEVFLEKHLGLVKGKKVGLITNPTGQDSRLRSTAELFHRSPDIQLAALYGPEHGVRGDTQGGIYVPFVIDSKFRVPVFSLYGQSMKADPGMLKKIDEYMRSFDTTDAGKALEKSMVRDIEVMVFDIQDIGTRVYTYVATMAYAMQSCAEAGIPFIVLDRPNPVNGRTLEGPVLEYPALVSFIGVYPVPLRHAMTAGELARLFNDKFMEKKVDLTVIPMEGWKREMWFDETELPWVIPSPNMPTLDTAAVYPGQVLFEGTNLSEGRGTTRPFEQCGAPWIDGYELAVVLNGLELPGVTFREAWFTPTFSKFQGEPCGGVQIHVTDREAFRPLDVSLQVLAAVRRMYPEQFAFIPDYFDRVLGTSSVRRDLEQGKPVTDILRSFEKGLEDFRALRREYLLY
ncbi:MAG: hypothetical protein A2Y56_04580 [Candidatus Aminicenantes bacterium RBG_13_63_10]|nr:MAG: hypothetical protein A2Y56_04580 [Candidatus Aminicenantes bacterium RBG_13_63_10]